jgi:hypothetical protein
VGEGRVGPVVRELRRRMDAYITEGQA